MSKRIRKMSRVLILALVLLLTLVGVAVQPAHAIDTCERFSSCSGPADCAWWGTRCALSNPFDFMDYMIEEYF